MSNLFKIGYFSLISQVPVKTLRYYDEIDLFKPSQSDPFTGYRYYTSSQLPVLYRILALKDLGLSLEQIKTTLSDPITNEQLSSLLRLRQTQLVAELQDREAQLQRIEARLQELTTKETLTMSNYEVVLKTVKPMLVASQRLVVPQNSQVPEMLGKSYQAICEHIDQQGGKFAGPCLTVWYTPSTQYTNEEVEAAFPLSAPIPASDAVQVRDLPEVYVASVVHHGNFDDFQQGHAHILKWAEANGYVIGDQYREIYITPPDAKDSATEVQFVVRKG